MKENKKVRNVLQKYMQWPVVLSALVLCANGAVGLVSGKAGMVMAVFTVLYAFCAGVLFWYGKKRILTGLVGFAADFDQSQKNLMASMELPYGIADEAGRLLWTNRAFSAVIRDEKSARRSLTVLFPEITEEGLEKMDHALEVQCAYGGAIYRASIKRVTIQSDSGLLSAAPGQKTEQQVLAVYLYDETEIHEYMQAITDQKMVAGLIYLDNYDEALESVEEVRRSLLTALIDRKITKYITAIMEVKSAMGVIVAAPTAGSCGGLPGTLIGVGRTLGLPREEIVKAMLAAGLIGVFIAESATFAAEVAGCQVECGAGSGMAAAGVALMLGGTVAQCLDAASMALQNITGLACDPVANRVEVPCLGKNIMCGFNAVACANMALAGFDKVIPLDETIAAVYDVGLMLPLDLR